MAERKASTSRAKTAKAGAAKAAKPRTGSRSGRPPGREPGLPSILVREVRDGLSVHDVLVAHLRLGADVAVAAAKAGVTRSSVYEWLRDGGRTAAAIQAGQRSLDDLTPTEQAVYRFAVAAVEAVADAEAQALGNVIRLARGSQRRRVTRKFEGAGPDAREVGRVEVVEDLPPDLAANVLVLERRFAERWARRQQIEVNVGDPTADGATESPLPTLIAALDAMETRRGEVEAEIAAATVVEDVRDG